ncbi:TPA: cytochrome C551 [Candidatus Beckwithbacteria bacterium]|nr:cytochrome C551 [Candidatus Beckwithbacteria bacterium]HAV66643.1 cytochrome C551 [Candidatus Beckwithbacteria bacterium]HBU22286.1 cytochrome C551 [Candidatus Beckwithbacteria bacterium]HCF00160.1 cytochrome C551 [Candidatus Beckwithbacteria bacterium]HCM44909.1 cytochrome C551 [Candidatus Beckwithbacteria bacterium]
MRKDKILVCQNCLQEFVWTLGEQEFFEKKGLSQPKLCPVCRGIEKAAREDKFRGRESAQSR